MTDTNYNSGDYNSGNHNSGYYNSGNYNSGDCNSGYYNSGYYSSGYHNSGDYNSGDHNSGHYNSGHYNSGDHNSGYFNSTTPEEIRVFNKPCLITTWEKAKKPKLLYQVQLTTWVPIKVMTEEEKKDNPDFFTKGGYLRQNNLREEFERVLESSSPEDIELLKALPNFDPDVFEEITGLRL